ncbi:MAG: hypothetical protein JW732_01815 [Dehalococcoidia bacterium]|nr:hypothetical protein [Dehalococcoidia bacterium]
MARQFWVVSPNVDGTGKNVEAWKQEIIRHRAAIIGWEPNNWESGAMGPRFAGSRDAGSKVQLGDIVLIARGKKSADIVGFGVVKGRIKAQQLPPWNRRVYMRELEPFKQCERVPKSIPILAVLQHTWALVQLHPEVKPDTRKVCEWMERQLTEQEKHSKEPRKVPLRKSKKSDYEVRTREQVKKLHKREERLLRGYQHWLMTQGRQLTALQYGRNECDAWEAERQNIIEAKAQTRREDIRMAVGQLFDYAFQMRGQFENPNKAILLPSEPPEDRVEWLEPLGIKLIWRSGRSFEDNAGGQFT